MESNCPTCGSNVVQILTGTHGSRYVMCMGCRQIAPVRRAPTPVHEPSECDQLPAVKPSPAAQQYQPPTGILS
jgi:formate dehydrogenase maturation protein FdhE